MSPSSPRHGPITQAISVAPPIPSKPHMRSRRSKSPTRSISAHRIISPLRSIAVTGAEKWRFDPKVGTQRVAPAPDLPGRHLLPGPEHGDRHALRRTHHPADRRRQALRARRGHRPDLPLLRAERQSSIFGRTCRIIAPAPITRHRRPPSRATCSSSGGAVNDNVSTSEPSGVIRAYNAADRAARLEFRQRQPGPDPAHRGGRDLYEEFAEQLGDPQRRSRPRPRLRADGQCAAGSVRRQPQRQHRAVLGLDHRARSRRPGRCAGCSRPCITICGTWTFRRSRSL